MPQVSGVYMFKDASGKVIYIGKAKSLRKRVQSYFSRHLDAKTQVMVGKIADISFQLTPSESGAEILEASLVKQMQPQYNIDLKDDKSFPWIRISAEEFPAVSIYRKKGAPKDEKVLYFGPYTNVKLLRQAIKLIRRVFGFRSCRRMPAVPCLYCRLHLCPGPCVGKITPKAYGEVIAKIKLFLSSKYEDLIARLCAEMKELAAKQQFEKAACVRDQLQALSGILQSSHALRGIDALEELRKVVKMPILPLHIEGIDISNISGQEACGSLVSFYNGLADKKNYRRFRIKTVKGIDDYAMLSEVIERRYRRLSAEKAKLPDLILIDGGKGHLLTAQKKITELGLVIPLIGLAKAKEHIYLQGRAAPLRLQEGSPALNLLRRVRDEAHRFAVSYHHLLHRKKTIGG